MKKIFLNEKPVEALVNIRNTSDAYGSKVSRDIDTTYAHTVTILSKLEEEGLIYSEEDGRRKIVCLTPKGERYASEFQKIVRMFENEKRADKKSF